VKGVIRKSRGEESWDSAEALTIIIRPCVVLFIHGFKGSIASDITERSPVKVSQHSGGMSRTSSKFKCKPSKKPA
jgi:hypothetical protein